MSRFLAEKFHNIEPYRLGEQPTDKKYIKLNSNETSFPASPHVLKAIEEAAKRPIGFYSDQDATVLREALAENYQVKPEQVFVGNGADEILSFCFTAYYEKGFAFPDITYGFYKTYMKAFKIPYEELPLKEDFTVDIAAFQATRRNIVLANPNAPTGLLLSPGELEELISCDPDRIVIIDEAYIDYGGKSCIVTLHRHPNLIVVHTMSKSRNIAGLHVGYAIASEELIEELNCIKNCFNPNNLNQVTLDAAVAAVKDQTYTRQCCQAKIKIREAVTLKLRDLGFEVLPSHTNFVFFTHPGIKATDLEKRLREHAVLVRHYSHPRIDHFLRMTIGTEEEMNTVMRAFQEIMATEKLPASKSQSSFLFFQMQQS